MVDDKTRLQIDFSFYVLHAANGAATTAVIPYPDASHYYYPDCGDFNMLASGGDAIADLPLPSGGGIEGAYWAAVCLRHAR